MISRYKRKKIVDFLVDGMTPFEIARKLKIDYKTAKKYADIFKPHIKEAIGIVRSIENQENPHESNGNPVKKFLGRFSGRKDRAE